MCANSKQAIFELFEIEYLYPLQLGIANKNKTCMLIKVIKINVKNDENHRKKI